MIVNHVYLSWAMFYKNTIKTVANVSSQKGFSFEKSLLLTVDIKVLIPPVLPPFLNPEDGDLLVLKVFKHSPFSICTRNLRDNSSTFL